MTVFNRQGIERHPNNAAGTYRYQEKCSRCGGAGGAQKWAHTGWTCFECSGSGQGKIVEEKLYSADKLAKLNATAAKRQAKKDAARQAAIDARNAELAATADQFAADNAGILNTLGKIREEYWQSVRRDIVAKQRVPSPKLIAMAEAALAKQNADDASEYVGQVGDRVTLRVTCKHIVALPKMFYGQAAQAIYICETDAGAAIVYKGSGEFIGRDDTADVVATVKEHAMYRDRKQTVIQRPRVLAVVLSPAE